MEIKNIVVGAGITGLTVAERLASKNEDVLIIEKRDHIGGNCYDYFDEDGCYIKKYGPHIFHTSFDDAWKYLSQFTDWNEYRHKVLCSINGRMIPIPFNLNSIDLCFSFEKAKYIKDKLLEKYGENAKISVFDLLNESDGDLNFLGNYVYENVFLNYTIKQWDNRPDEIDKSVLNRVPVIVNRRDRYFNDAYEGIPSEGYTKMFDRMVENSKIRIMLNTDYKNVIGRMKYERMFYTGPLDYFFDYKFGPLKYRRIRLEFEKHEGEYQENSVINYPNENNFTRITEFNKFLFLKRPQTVIAKEYASWDKGFLAYPLQKEDNHELKNKYLQEAKKLSNVKFIGRLAQCQYLNMDQSVKAALEAVG